MGWVCGRTSGGVGACFVTTLDLSWATDLELDSGLTCGVVNCCLKMPSRFIRPCS
jgi:hypothetical protein